MFVQEAKIILERKKSNHHDICKQKAKYDNIKKAWNGVKPLIPAHSRLRQEGLVTELNLTCTVGTLSQKA